MADTMVRHRTVTGVLQFTVPTGEKIITQVSKTGGGRDDPKTGQYEMKEITIQDGRPIAEELDMEVQGFEFLKYDTAVTDFTDDEQVKNIYYPELEKLLLERTGAKEVLIFDHTIRVGDAKKREKLGVRDPVRSAHNDFTDNSAPQRVKDLLPPEEAEDKFRRRFTSINVWRPLTGPDTPVEVGLVGQVTARPALLGEPVGIVEGVDLGIGQRLAHVREGVALGVLATALLENRRYRRKGLGVDRVLYPNRIVIEPVPFHMPLPDGIRYCPA